MSRAPKKPREWVRWLVMWSDNWPSGTLHGTRKDAVRHGNDYGVEPVSVIKVRITEIIPTPPARPRDR